MPKLSCNVNTCIHNNCNCCCKGAIDVSGKQADTSSETCCSSFYEDTGNARDALEQEPIVDTEVACKAENCCHNKDCKCHADSIDVSGNSACCCDDTCCSSFVPQ